MAYIKKEERILNSKFLIEAKAYKNACKRFSSQVERELYMQGVSYALKQYQHLINKKHEEMDN